MSTQSEGAPGKAPLDVRLPGRADEQESRLAGTAGMRRRRAASQRMAPLDDGPRDPMDALAGILMGTTGHGGGYDVTTLGLDCQHGPNCPARPGRGGA